MQMHKQRKRKEILRPVIRTLCVCPVGKKAEELRLGMRPGLSYALYIHVHVQHTNTCTPHLVNTDCHRHRVHVLSNVASTSPMHFDPEEVGHVFINVPCHVLFTALNYSPDCIPACHLLTERLKTY